MNTLTLVFIGLPTDLLAFKQLAVSPYIVKFGDANYPAYSQIVRTKLVPVREWFRPNASVVITTFNYKLTVSFIIVTIPQRSCYSPSLTTLEASPE